MVSALSAVRSGRSTINYVEVILVYSIKDSVCLHVGVHVGVLHKTTGRPFPSSVKLWATHLLNVICFSLLHLSRMHQVFPPQLLTELRHSLGRGTYKHISFYFTPKSCPYS